MTLGTTFKTFTQKQIENEKNLNNTIQNTSASVQDIKDNVKKMDGEVKKVNEIVSNISGEFVSTTIFNNYKKEVNSKLASVYTVKGSIANYATLSELQEKNIGDVYNVLTTGANYVYTAEGWDKLSENFDVSELLTKEEAEKKYIQKDILENYILKEEFQKLADRVSALEKGGNV